MFQYDTSWELGLAQKEPNWPWVMVMGLDGDGASLY